MDLTTLRDITRRLVHNRDEMTNAVLDVAINDAYFRIARGRFLNTRRISTAIRHPELEAQTTQSLQTDTSAYAYPSDADEIDAIDFPLDASKSTWRRLFYIPWAEFADYDQVRGEETQFWSTYGRQYYVTPRPDLNLNGTQLRIWYYIGSRVPKLSSGSDEPKIAEPYHSVIAYLAGRDLLRQTGDEERAEALNNQIILRLNEIQAPTNLRTAANSAFNRPIPLLRRG